MARPLPSPTKGERETQQSARTQMNILLTPARIGPVEIKNRIVMPPMTTRTADDEGFVTEDCIAYYLARVQGGTGLITVEMASPEKAGRHRRREIGIYDDRFISGLKRLVDAIHGGGAKASIQLGHAGGHTRIDICGETPIAPSAIPHPVYETTFETIVPQEMAKARIEETIAAHAAAALRARRAARGEKRGAGYRGRVPAIGRGFLPRRPAFQRRPPDRDLGRGGRRRRAAYHRGPLSLTTFRAGRVAADEFFRRHFSRLRGRCEKTRGRSGHCGRPSRRSSGRRARGKPRQNRFHRARPHAHCRAAVGGEGAPRRADPALSFLQYLHQRDARRR